MGVPEPESTWFFFFFPFKTLENPQQYRSVEKNLEGQPEVGHVLGPE